VIRHGGRQKWPRSRRAGLKLTLWVLLALALVAVGYFGVGLFVASRLSTPSRQPEEHSPADLGLDHHEVSP